MAAQWRHGLAAWRHSGRTVWRHGGTAWRQLCHWRHGGTDWRHGGTAWRHGAWRVGMSFAETMYSLCISLTMIWEPSQKIEKISHFSCRQAVCSDQFSQFSSVSQFSCCQAGWGRPVQFSSVSSVCFLGRRRPLQKGEAKALGNPCRMGTVLQEGKVSSAEQYSQPARLPRSGAPF